MSNLYEITTASGKTYARRAWTGGNKPDIDFATSPEGKELIQAFYDDQVKDSGGLDFWECAGTTSAERREIFMNRALLDAWRTLNP